MGKSSKRNNTIHDFSLKSRGKRSHNQTQLEAHIKALVANLARQAAEEDFKMLRDALRSPDKQ